jgi:hypothetical protein
VKLLIKKKKRKQGKMEKLGCRQREGNLPQKEKEKSGVFPLLFPGEKGENWPLSKGLGVTPAQVSQR